jgi:hypothetical protein
MAYTLNTVPTKNVVNSEENILVYVQQVPFYMATEHAEGKWWLENPKE